MYSIAMSGTSRRVDQQALLTTGAIGIGGAALGAISLASDEGSSEVVRDGTSSQCRSRL